IIVDSLKSESGISIIEINNDDEKSRRFGDNDIKVAIEIPENYEELLISRENIKITLTSINGESIKELVYGIIKPEILNLSNISEVSNGNKEIYKEALDNYSNNSIISIGKKSLNDLYSDYNYGQFFVGFLIIFMLQRGLSGAKHVYEEKDENVYSRIFMAPVSAWQYYLGDALSTYIVILIQAFIGVVAINYFNIQIGVGSVILFIILSLIGLVSVGISICGRAFVEDISGFSNLFNFINMILIMLGGCAVPIEMMPASIEKISYFTPTRWAMQSIIDIQQGKNFSEIYVNLGILILFAIAFFVIGAYKTSRDEKKFTTN
ncbi:MAG: ABC transporter permease, partial [Clostridium sp.]